MVVPGVVVHHVEGRTPGLYGSRSGAHDVPWKAKSASLDTFFRRQVWTDLLKPQHSGISMDVLLFSYTHMSLVHKMKRRFRLRYSSSTTRVQFCQPFRSSSSSSHPSTGCFRRSCASPLIGSHFCRMWHRPTVSDGWHTTWLPWDWVVHPVRRGFRGPCRRRHVTLACHAVTAFQIYLSSSVQLGCCDSNVTVYDFKLVNIGIGGYFATYLDLS